MNGFFQLQRRFFNHWLWKDDERIFSRAEAFLDLLQLAAFTRTKKVVGASLIGLEPGQIVASERFMAGRWKWSTSKVRAFLTLLEADRMVAKEIKQGVTVLTLCNYQRYASGADAEKAGSDHLQSNREAASKRKEEGKEAIARESDIARRPTLEQAIAAGSETGICAEVVRTWWEAREASDWVKGTQGGGNTKVGPNWRADLSRSRGWAEEELAKSKQPARPHGGGNGNSNGSRNRSGNVHANPNNNHSSNISTKMKSTPSQRPGTGYGESDEIP